MPVDGGFSVTVDDLAVSVRTFAGLHADELVALDAAATGLAAHAGMAGDDAVLAPWRELFDVFATATWAVHATAAATLHDVAARLAVTGDNYLAADAASGGGPADPLPVVAPPRTPAAPPPSSTGPAGPAVPVELAAYWPGGDPDLLRAAAAIWMRLGDDGDAVAGRADSAFAALSGAGSGATFSAIAAYWARHYERCGTDPLFNAGPVTARLLAHACSALAEVIDTTRDEVSRAAAQAAEELDHVEVPAHVLGRFTRGTTVAILEAGKAALTTKLLDAYAAYYLADVERLVTDLRRIDLPHLHALAAPPPPQPAVEVGLTDLGEVLGLGLTGSAWDDVDGSHPDPDAVHLSEAGRDHILDGEAGGSGGHRSGRGVPGKSEFPPSWSDDQIVTTALALARAPDAVPRVGEEERWVVEGVRNGVRLRVIVDGSGEIVTAYPLSGPGVVQNPRR